MQRLSSRLTYFHTRVFPAIWFGSLAAGEAFLLVESIASKQPWLALFAIPPALFALFGIYVFRRYVFDLADEAWLEDHQVRVVRRGQQTTIEMFTVNAVETRLWRNPPRVTLVLRTPCAPFGGRVSFIPKSAMFVPGLQRHPVARALDQQIATASRWPA
jgi:hypothetical protein